MYSVVLSEEVGALYARADRPLARKLARCFAQLQQDPRRHNNIKRLTGVYEGLYRYRIGDWRVIYEIHDAARQVDVVTVAHRKDAYD